tara:strand:+ start:1579 stop:2505 length:927 start_codon:yes stop_codon:yes gene_type:complete
MTEKFQGNLKRIQWNNKLKTAVLSLYFIFGIFLFTTLLLLMLIIASYLIVGAFHGYENLFEVFLKKIIFFDFETGKIIKIAQLYAKIFIFIIFAYFYFMYSHMKRIGKFFCAVPLQLSHNDIFYQTLENFCIARGLKVPNLYITQKDGYIPDRFITGIVVQDLKGKASLIITPAVYNLEKPLMEAFLAQVVQRIFTKDTLFLTQFCFIGYFPYHLREGSNIIFKTVAKAPLYVIDKILKPVRNWVLNMRFGRLDVGALELTKEKKPMDELLNRLTPLEEIQKYIHDPYLTLFITKTSTEYRKVLLKKA